MKRATIIEIIIFLYAVLFLYTGISKLMEYSVFKEQIAESPVLAPAASLIAALLPFTELLIVLMLVIPRWRMKGLYAVLGMMTAFTIYVIALLSFNDKLPCSCGGIISELSWSQHLIFNSVFIILAILGIVFQKRQQRANPKIWSHIGDDQSILPKGM